MTNLSPLLSQISPKLKDSLVALSINHVVTSIAANTFSMLQLALALLVNGKRVIETLHEFGITPTYHEVRRFMISAAAAADKNGLFLNMNASDGLIQVITDNSVATINSQNGMKQTHALASIFAQANCSEEDNNEFKFARLKQELVKSVALRDIPLSIYNGPRKPEMDPYFAIGGIPPLKLLCTQTLLAERSRVEDFRFLKRSLLEEHCPDFHGFNTNETRIVGHSTKPKSKIIFRQFIDHTPSEPSTMLTGMVDVEKVTNAASQKITVFTADQQLYSVVLDIMWADCDRWVFFVPQLGGMHWLMSFIGRVGALMASSGLKEILSREFAGSDKMIQGKKIPYELKRI